MDGNELGRIPRDDLKSLNSFFNDTMIKLEKYRLMREELKTKTEGARNYLSDPDKLEREIRTDIFIKILEPYKNLNLGQQDYEPIMTMTSLADIVKYARTFIDRASDIAYENIRNQVYRLIPYKYRHASWESEYCTVEASDGCITKEYKKSGCDLLLKVYMEDGYNGRKIAHQSTGDLHALGKFIEVVVFGVQPTKATGQLIGQHYAQYPQNEGTGAFMKHPLPHPLEFIQVYKNGKVQVRFKKTDCCVMVAEHLTGKRTADAFPWHGIKNTENVKYAEKEEKS